MEDLSNTMQLVPYVIPQHGRPSKFSEELAWEIAKRISDGRSLKQVCDDSDIPNYKTVLTWVKDRPDFAAIINTARAEKMEGDSMALRAMAKDVLTNPETDPRRAQVAINAIAHAAKISVLWRMAPALTAKPEDTDISSDEAFSILSDALAYPKEKTHGPIIDGEAVDASTDAK